MGVKREIGVVLKVTEKSYVYTEFFKDGNGNWYIVGSTSRDVLERHGINNPYNKSITNIVEQFARGAYTKLNSYLKEIGKDPVPTEKVKFIEYWSKEDELDEGERFYEVDFEDKRNFERPKWRLIFENRGDRPVKREKVLQKVYGRGTGLKP